MSLALSLYQFGSRLLEPLAPMLLRRRAARGKEDPARFEERLGFATLGVADSASAGSAAAGAVAARATTNATSDAATCADIDRR